MQIVQLQVAGEDDLFLVEIDGAYISSCLTEKEPNINTKWMIVITHDGLY